MKNITDVLIEKVKETNNPTVMGLDPKMDYIPSFMREGKDDTEAILAFNKSLIDVVYDIIPAVKPNLAFYEVFGVKGIECFIKTCEYAALKGMVVIADGKRNDIGSTASAYAKAYFGKNYMVDFLTINPYLGEDGIKPFIEVSQNSSYTKGVFGLVKTSNESSGQLQDLKLENGKLVYEQVAELLNTLNADTIGENGYGIVGAVVGATYPKQLAALRKLMPKSYILIPGYGAQGGTSKDIAVGFDKKGLGAIVNSSRGLMCAYKSDMWKDKYTQNSFTDATRAEALYMKDDINSALGK